MEQLKQAIKIKEHLVFLGFNMFCCQIVKRCKLVKNGSVYAAPKSRHLWLRTRPGWGVRVGGEANE